MHTQHNMIMPIFTAKACIRGETAKARTSRGYANVEHLLVKLGSDGESKVVDLKCLVGLWDTKKASLKKLVLAQKTFRISPPVKGRNMSWFQCLSLLRFTQESLAMRPCRPELSDWCGKKKVEQEADS